MLMLEGHFIGLTLSLEARDPSHPVYFIWEIIRGFNAPLFFTTAGMIFVFLLAGEKDPIFYKSNRVRKGLWRAAELLFWGYALQLNVQYIPDYLQGKFNNWVFAFHVLQCIGVGLISLILIAAAQKAVGKASLVVWYAISTVLCVIGYIWLQNQQQDVFIPAGWPQIIQNILNGPESIFPALKWLGFALLGGAMGAYVRSINHLPPTLKSCVWFFILAGALKLIWVAAVFIPMPEKTSTALSWFTERSSEVVAFLGVLRWIEIRYGIGVPWMLRIGQETFAIYILHVIVLYGGFFGLGLNNYFKENLGPWQAAGGAALFIACLGGYGLLLNLWKTRKRKLA